jgi:hypothetical protein
MAGGVAPGGSERSAAWVLATTWAMAVAIFTRGWKNTLMTPMPETDCDSTCSMSLTAVVTVALHRQRAALAHLLGGQAVVAEQDADQGDVDLGEHVDRHAADHPRHGQHQQQGDDDEGVRPAQGQLDDPHGAPLLSPARAGLPRDGAMLRARPGAGRRGALTARAG